MATNGEALMNRLVEIGFEKVGYWHLDGDRLGLELHRMASKTNILYAFVCDGEVKYIGKTKSTLASRFNGYRSPSRTQTTNVRNNSNIRALLAMGASVDILALPDDGLLHYGRFHLNLAAGLEDDLIRVLDPEWNGGRVELELNSPRPPSTTGVAEPFSGSSLQEEEPVASVTREPDAEAQFTAPLGEFQVVLHTTYYHQGFFNVRVPQQELFAGDGEPIEIFVSREVEPIEGMINRTANTNGTPRIMGGRQLRDWFYEAAQEKGEIRVIVMTPNSIRLEVSS